MIPVSNVSTSLSPAMTPPKPTPVPGVPQNPSDRESLIGRLPISKGARPPLPSNGAPPPLPGAGMTPPAPTPIAGIAGSPLTSGIPAPAGGANTSPIPLAGASQAPTLATNTPGGANDYLDKTIQPGAGTDRLALAKSNFENFRTSTDPEYQATLRDAGQSGAAAGQIGSGMLRGRLGDIGTTRARDLQSAQTGFLNDATEGSIGDAYRNIGIAQQQQGFQGGQQQNAFNQAERQQQMKEYLRNGQFGRSATQLALGGQGNPADTALALSGYYGGQASDAGTAAGNLFGGLGRKPPVPSS